MPDRRLLAIAAGAALALGGCGSRSGDTATAPASSGAGAWRSVLREARGQTVRFWLYGGDQRVNAYVDDEVRPVLARYGVRVQRVPVADTADAVKRVVAERRAGRTSGGGVDLIWINGENFATGKQAGLWLKGWSGTLPNARYLDRRDPSIATDFRVPVDGQESPWQRATFVFARDSARVRTPPRTLDDLFAYARAHPGRVTYPAPPDFTGSAFVRQVVAAKGRARGLRDLKALKRYLYRRGTVFPKSQAELEQLFGDGQVDFAMGYEANLVEADVRKGLFPRTARPFTLAGGALTNVSFVTIPAGAAHIEGAKVLANVLLDPRLQARKADPRVLGNPTVLDAARLPPAKRELAARAAHGPYLLARFGRPVGEFAARDVAPLERLWAREVLR